MAETILHVHVKSFFVAKTQADMVHLLLKYRSSMSRLSLEISHLCPCLPLRLPFQHQQSGWMPPCARQGPRQHQCCRQIHASCFLQNDRFECWRAGSKLAINALAENGGKNPTYLACLLLPSCCFLHVRDRGGKCYW